MPQMFPMPTIFLVIMVSTLFLVSIVRVYWHHLNAFFHLNNETSFKTTSSSFSQSW